MKPNPTSSIQPQATHASPVMDVFHGMQCGLNGVMSEAIQKRLGFSHKPTEAGR